MDEPDDNPRSLIERLRELTQVQRELAYGLPGCSHCVELLTAMERIRTLSSGAHQWLAHPVSGLHFRSRKWSQRYLVVAYSNPDTTGLPNHLCFCLPILMGRIGPEGTRTLLACFAPESIVPLSTGLYWENDDLKEDSVGDYILLSEVLERCLWPQHQSKGFGNSMESEQTNLMLGGISYGDSIQALVRMWSQSKEMLRNKIQAW